MKKSRSSLNDVALSQAHADARKLLRQQVRAKRQQLTREQQHTAAERVAKRLLSHPAIQRAVHLAAFLSFDNELDTQPLIAKLWQANKHVYLPIIHPFTPGHLLFSRYTPTTELVAGPYGILAPRLDVRTILPLSQLNIILTPLVAFDDRGYRLGMGGGYYDRTLAGYTQHDLLPIGIGHQCQQVAHVPIEAWDVPLPEIITDQQHWSRA